MEPEDIIGQALYLLQLCQQDLNIGRKNTILARAKKAKELCEELEKWSFCNKVDPFVEYLENEAQPKDPSEWRTQYTVGELNKLMEEGISVEQIFEAEKKNPMPGRTW